MRGRRLGLVVGFGVVLSAACADSLTAGESTFGMTVTSQRDVDDFDVPQSTKYQVSGSHSFDSGLSLGASAVLQDDAFSGTLSENLEGTIGYRARFDSVFSMNFRGGLGERFRAARDGGNFPYYVFYIDADVRLTERWTWNAVAFRYRDAFDPDENYNTPQLGTGLTYGLTEHTSLSAIVSRSWTDWVPSSNNVALGLKYGF